MSRRTPFIAPALVAAVLCIVLYLTVIASGRDRFVTMPAATACFTLLEEGVALSTSAGVETLPASRGGQDVVGRKMPPLHFDRWLNTQDGQPVETSDGVTLYRWWTDGCEHCEKTLPAVERLRQKFGARGLRVVAVYHPKPPRAVTDRHVLDAAKGLGYSGAVAVDLDWSELKKFYLSTGDRRATSASFVVGRDGVIRFVHPGPRFYPSDDATEAQEDADYRLLEAAIDKLLK